MVQSNPLFDVDFCGYKPKQFFLSFCIRMDFSAQIFLQSLFISLKHPTAVFTLAWQFSLSCNLSLYLLTDSWDKLILNVPGSLKFQWFSTIPFTSCCFLCANEQNFIQGRICTRFSPFISFYWCWICSYRLQILLSNLSESTIQFKMKTSILSIYSLIVLQGIIQSRSIISIIIFNSL